MTPRIGDYEPIVGRDVVEELRLLAGHVDGRRLQNINSTAVGGGVAEIHARMVPLLQDLGIDATWDVIKGDDAFFDVTKALHNALHGAAEPITASMLEAYRRTTEDNLAALEISGDVVLVHDPQPAGLIARKRDLGGKWVWRCHIDVSAPDRRAWQFLRPLIEQYDAAIFSMPAFAQRLPIPQFLVAPSIDPLADKNRDLEPAEIEAVLQRFGIDAARPILIQVSRFDRLKDPLGVIAAYRLVRRRRDCQLVLAGGAATDDPEGAEVLREVQEAAGDDPDIHVLSLPPFSDIEINALVRGATIVVQKSVREGFGLTVTEAMWKRKPVIASAVGGIRQQVIDGETGFLVYSPEGTAHRAIRLLGDPALRRRLGDEGRAHVAQNFLLTRHLKDYLLIMLALDHLDEHVVRL